MGTLLLIKLDYCSIAFSCDTLVLSGSFPFKLAVLHRGDIPPKLTWLCSCLSLFKFCTSGVNPLYLINSDALINDKPN